MSKFISTALKLWKGLDKGHSQELLPGGANVPGYGRPETPPGVWGPSLRKYYIFIVRKFYFLWFILVL